VARLRKPFILVMLLGVALAASACRSAGAPASVVVYTSVDQIFSEPILRAFEQESGIRVLAVYDVEATKTTGLVNRLIAERDRPQADVFWSGEFVQTILLKREGVLAPYRSLNRSGIPDSFIDPDGYWTGFGGRARLMIVNTDQVAGQEFPHSIFDLLGPEWPADQIGIAHPLFGTAATQAAALYAALGPEQARAYYEGLWDRGVQIVDGNSVVRDMVASGQLAVGLTDTDDACGAIQRGAPVAAIFPDQGPGELGTLIIPNTVALIAGGPNLESGELLIDFLLSAEAMNMMVESGWSHVPQRRLDAAPSCFAGLTIQDMGIPLEDIYEQLERAQGDLAAIFVR
jgi:iron(III) transport system substrate-binding protein